MRSALEVFINKVSRVETYSFFQQMSNQQTGWMLSLGHSPDQLLIGPTLEQADAALLTVRLLIQNNDSISIHNVFTAAKLLLSKEDLNQFAALRNSLNAHLDSYPGIGIYGKPASYRELLELYLYGDRAHTSQSKRQRQDLETFSTCPISDYFIWNFYIAAYWVLLHAMLIRNLLIGASTREAKG